MTALESRTHQAPCLRPESRRYGLRRRLLLALLALIFWSPGSSRAAEATGALSQLPDGGYRFECKAYTAIVDPAGHLASLVANGQELLSPRSYHSQSYGASLVWGPGHRTMLDLPKLVIENGMVVARGEGREISFRFAADGIDFLFDLPSEVHWVVTLNRNNISHVADLNGQVLPLAEASTAPMLAAKARSGIAIQVEPKLVVHTAWLEAWNAPNVVTAGYQTFGQGKSEAHLKLMQHAGWSEHLQLVSIESPAADHLFPAGQSVRFAFGVRNQGEKPFAGRLVLDIADHSGLKPARQMELEVKVPAGTTVDVPWEFQPTEPIVSKTQARLCWQDETVVTRDLVFVYDAEQYRPPLTRPDDFQAFWQSTLAEMRSRPIDLQIKLAPELSNAHKQVSLVSFNTLDRRRLEGWLEEPTAPGKYRGNVCSRVNSYEWPKPGPDDKTNAVSLTMKAYHDAIYRHDMATRETAEFRHVYADTVRCVDVLLSRDNVDPQQIVALGASRSGPSAFAAAALDPRIALVEIHVPTSAGNSWPTGFYGGWGASVHSGRPAEMVDQQAWLRLLGYFDMVNFAPDVKCPVVIGLGLRDYDLSPAPGILAAYGYLSGPRALGASPWEGHCYPLVYQKLAAQFEHTYLPQPR